MTLILTSSACVHCTTLIFHFGNSHICETMQGPETTRSFKCSIPLARGAQSQFYSATMRGLISHKVRAHGFHELVQRAVITNECPWCRSIFSKRLDAQHHACSSVLHCFCRAGGSHVQTGTRQPQCLVECPLCKKYRCS